MKLVGKISGFLRIFSNKSLAAENGNKQIESDANLKKANDLILEELAFVQNQLECANVVFNAQTNLDLIESSIYHIDSLEKKYNYLLKEARRRQLKNVF